jgi:4-diphosphocytidyl-2-C-methyl-D-erythritol kinase
MIFFPSAKINIGLRITGKRSDGYHNIETIFYPVSLSDALEYVVSDHTVRNDTLRTTGIDTGSDPEKNLVMKTVIRLRREISFPFLNIHLHKAIPVGAGLGGGSSDAACMLKVLNRHFKLNCDSQQLRSLALELGSDCPFFIDCTPCHATGRGEILTPVRPVLAGYYLVIINQGIKISTSEAYQQCKAEVRSESLMHLFELPVTEWEGAIKNDFEDFAFSKHPVLRDLKKELYKSDAVFSLMSGSGSSVYGIFKEKPELPLKLREFVIWEGIL